MAKEKATITWVWCKVCMVEYRREDELPTPLDWKGEWTCEDCLRKRLLCEDC